MRVMRPNCYSWLHLPKHNQISAMWKSKCKHNKQDATTTSYTLTQQLHCVHTRGFSHMLTHSSL